MQIKSPMPVSYGEGRLTIEMKARDLTGPSILPYPFEARYAGCAEITRSKGGKNVSSGKGKWTLPAGERPWVCIREGRWPIALSPSSDDVRLQNESRIRHP